MKKPFKRLSVLLIGALTCSAILMSCTPAKDVAEGVKNGATDIVQGVKEGAKDVKKGTEDMVGSGENQGNKSKGEFDTSQHKASNAALVGSWAGMKSNGDAIRISLYEDSTYETVETTKDSKKMVVYSGKYSTDTTSITFNKEKKMENEKTVDNKEVDKKQYMLKNSNNLEIKNQNNKDGINLHKENNLADKKIK